MADASIGAVEMGLIRVSPDAILPSVVEVPLSCLSFDREPDLTQPGSAAVSDPPPQLLQLLLTDNNDGDEVLFFSTFTFCSTGLPPC